MVVTLLSLASSVQSRNCIPAITAESRAFKGDRRTELQLNLVLPAFHLTHPRDSKACF